MNYTIEVLTRDLEWLRRCVNALENAEELDLKGSMNLQTYESQIAELEWAIEKLKEGYEKEAV
jgi:hypothetical protein